jgi:DNA-binding NarL/FixJ family response regulator
MLRGGTKVYLVEDSPIIRQLLAELIETTGARIVGWGHTASAAIADIEVLQPDAVTIDLFLKKGTGFDVLKALATGSDTNSPLRIVLTNYNSDSHRDAAKRLGAHFFFDKATQIREVLEALEHVVRKPEHSTGSSQAQSVPGSLLPTSANAR